MYDIFERKRPKNGLQKLTFWKKSLGKRDVNKTLIEQKKANFDPITTR